MYGEVYDRFNSDNSLLIEKDPEEEDMKEETASLDSFEDDELKMELEQEKQDITRETAKLDDLEKDITSETEKLDNLVKELRNTRLTSEVRNLTTFYNPSPGNTGETSLINVETDDDEPRSFQEAWWHENLEKRLIWRKSIRSILIIIGQKIKDTPLKNTERL